MRATISSLLVVNATINAVSPIVTATIGVTPTVNASITLEINDMPIYVGDVSIITCTITDQFGAPQDPGVVTAAVQTPDGVITPQNPFRVSKGLYTINYTWTEANTTTVIFTGNSPYPFNQVAYYKPLPLPFNP